MLEWGGESVDLGLVFFYEGLELRDLLLDGEGVSGQGAGLEGGLAQSEGEGLVDIVVGQPLGFAGVGLLFGGDSEGSEGFDGLPRTLIDEGVLSGCAFATEEWQMRHGSASPPGAHETEHEKGGGYRDREAAKKLHDSTLYVLDAEVPSPQGGCRI